MRTSVSVDDVLRAHSLRRVASLSGSRGAEVYKVMDEAGESWVLKCYSSKPGEQQRDLAFYQAALGQQYKYLHVPRLYKVGDGYSITEFVDREIITKSSIMERTWTEADVDLWVRGLLEFQETQVSHQSFAAKKKIFGYCYPAFRMGELLGRTGPDVSYEFKLSVCGMMARYAAARLFYKSVLVHYDLNLSNYTFHSTERKMSIIDFDFSYYKGDPLFDLIYYCALPMIEMSKWTFQKHLMRRYLELASYKNGYTNKWENRMRAILMLCALSRYLKFKDKGDVVNQNIYKRNIDFVMNDLSYDGLLSDVRGR